MKIQNAYELIGKEVCDANGNTVGYIDKTWQGWNDEYPGYFFGIRPNENTRDTWFRGTGKLIPIYSDYIKDVNEKVWLNKTTEELGKFWNKTIYFPNNTWCPTDELVEKPVYDKNHSRVGWFYAWVESDGTFKNYGLFMDPYLSDTWKLPFNTIMPLPTNYITQVKDTVWLDKSLEELREYWKQNYHF